MILDVVLNTKLLAPTDTHVPQAKFLFEGPIAGLLAEHLDRDIQNARLSQVFKWFYLIRPYLPLFCRQLLQQRRNRAIAVDPQWFVPHRFLEELELLIESNQVPSLAKLWPNDAQYALVLTHDIETEVGMRRVPEIAALEEELGFRSAWYVVPHKYPVDYGVLKDIQQRGFEVGIHGYNHDGRLFASRRTFRSRLPAIHAAMEKCGATGFRSPMVHRNLNWMQELQMDYDASCFDVDPYQAMPGGVGSLWPFIYGRFVELPYTLPQDHTLWVTLGETSDRIWCEKLEIIKRYSGMAMMLSHPDYMDSPDKLDIYRGFLQKIRDAGEYWHVLPREMSRWVRQRIES